MLHTLWEVCVLFTSTVLCAVLEFLILVLKQMGVRACTVEEEKSVGRRRRWFERSAGRQRRRCYLFVFHDKG